MTNSTLIVDILERISTNNYNLLNSNLNPDLSRLSQMIEAKLSKNQILKIETKNVIISQSFSPTCESQLEDAKDGCVIAAGVGLGTSILSGLISLGTGTVVGLVSTTLAAAACFGRANLQYDCCKNPNSLNC